MLGADLNHMLQSSGHDGLSRHVQGTGPGCAYPGEVHPGVQGLAHPKLTQIWIFGILRRLSALPKCDTVEPRPCNPAHVLCGDKTRENPGVEDQDDRCPRSSPRILRSRARSLKRVLMP